MSIENKKILVIGFGIEGRALTEFLYPNNRVKVADANLELDPELIQKFKSKGVKFQLGPDYLDNITDFELIAHSPGLKAATLDTIKASNVPTTTQMQIFFDLSPTKNIIGITGTNGKGTTSTLIHQILTRAGKTAYLAGNIGVEALPLLNGLGIEDYVVLELSSYQLRDLRTSPHIGVILNITPDHLDIHGDFESYVSAKANIIRFQSVSDHAVLNGDYPVTEQLSTKTKGNVHLFHKTDVASFQIKLPGEHNKENAAAALSVARILGIDDSIISAVFTEFSGLEHRLQTISHAHGINWIDDSISTTPETAIAAIEAIKGPKVLILGGSRKSSTYEKLAVKIAEDKSIRGAVLIGITGDNEILTELNKLNLDIPILTGAKDMNEAVSQAFSLAKTGDSIVLSPASASFDWFRNYADRATKFKEAIKYCKI